ncbi:MAG: Stp1/IreP family PP2C-type Ser/Thr phosphatase [Nitrospirae bacterium]|nr:Stp1/IreP family PP2C-type Ser/Thr phosphatase [Nitrospirota bacterium]
MHSSYQIEAEGLTDVGRKRQINEDAILLTPEQHLYLLADGLGGHLAGEVASQLAVKTIRDFLSRFNPAEDTWPVDIDPSRSDAANALATGIQLANRTIFNQAGMTLSQNGMATTLAALRIVQDTAVIAHVGDSRLYRIRDDKILQLTEDHTVINELRRQNHLPADAAAQEDHSSRYRHVLTRALGQTEAARIDLREEPLRDRDFFLLCSDGLSNMVSDDRILILIHQRSDSLKAACQSLVDEANKNGGKDNISCILVRCTIPLQ